MILMASSIRYTLEEAKVLDSLLHGAVELADVSYGNWFKWSGKFQLMNLLLTASLLLVGLAVGY